MMNWLEEDFMDLLKTGRMNRAIFLSKELSKYSKTPIYFSHTHLPHYPIRNLTASTVFIHLNPGADVGDVTNEHAYFMQTWNYYKFLSDFNLNSEPSLADMIRAYEDFWNNYATKRFIYNLEKDNFDYKQACFLLHWEESGINLLKTSLQDPDVQRQNTVNVLDEKLQLELIPYCSSAINTKTLVDSFENEPEIIQPYIESMLNTIVLHPRKYIIFGSRIFQQIFRIYNSNISQIIEFEAPEVRFDGITSKRLSFTYLRLKWKNTLLEAGLAHSFPRRDLPNAYEKMAKYGEACFREFNKHSLK